MGEMIVDGFMVLTGCAGLVFTVYGVLAWRISAGATKQAESRDFRGAVPAAVVRPV